METETDAVVALPRARRWRHAQLPGHATARPVEAVRAGAMTEKAFWRGHVDQMRPCLIAGAVAHWPAMKLWQSPEHLLDRVGPDQEVVASTHPRIEYAQFTSIEGQLRQQNDDTRESMPFHDFLRRATAPRSGHLVCHSYDVSKGRELRELRRLAKRPLAAAARSPFEPLARDLAGFPFLGRARPARIYPPYRAFLFRSSYTDWHWHITDETLMCQIDGAKEVLLLPPDEEAWGLLWPIMQEYGRTFDHDVRHRLAGAKLQRVVVEPGDALYIPPYWWHSVEAVEDRLGATVSACFRSSLASAGDLRNPGLRFLWREQLRRSALRSGALMAAAVASSHLLRLRQSSTRRES